mmetsp:Transcript_137165/g.273665  ORF Transcript_137165/g.273665 Transcript_137165/m.273665 type:complete len:237 (-) Transcript_137165:2597-3307(-)
MASVAPCSSSLLSKASFLFNLASFAFSKSKSRCTLKSWTFISERSRLRAIIFSSISKALSLAIANAALNLLTSATLASSVALVQCSSSAVAISLLLSAANALRRLPTSRTFSSSTPSRFCSFASASFILCVALASSARRLSNSELRASSVTLILLCSVRRNCRASSDSLKAVATPCILPSIVPISVWILLNSWSLLPSAVVSLCCITSRKFRSLSSDSICTCCKTPSWVTIAANLL